VQLRDNKIGDKVNKIDLLWEPYLQLVWERFVHRTDAYTEQWYSPEKGGGYYPVREGTCTHNPPCKIKRNCSDLSLVALDKSAVVEHLHGTRTIGLYQLGDNDTVKWMCFDVDIAKGSTIDPEIVRGAVQSYTIRIAQFLKKLKGKNTFLVEDTGSKGYHIWVFFDAPVQAVFANAVGRWAQANLPAPDGIHLEVFPKQITTARFGNLVKLPFGVHKKTKKRCYFVDGFFNPLNDQLAALRDVITWSEDDLKKIIDTYQISLREEGSDRDGETPTGFVCMSRIMKEGLGEGTRDAGIFRLSLFLKFNGLTESMTESVANIVNSKSSPPMNDQEVSTKVESAYTSTYSPFPCGDRLIDSYCSSSCRFWNAKVREHWTKLGKK
jgi:hypothetical protein